MDRDTVLNKNFVVFNPVYDTRITWYDGEVSEKRGIK